MEDNFSNRNQWSAGELAKAAGVSTDTLRHYERKGVLPLPRRAQNGYRIYPETALRRVQLIRQALVVGFTLDELARVLSERDKGGAPCQEVRELAAEKLLNIEKQLNGLAALREEIRLTLSDWDERLSKADSGAQVGLLESLRLSREPENKSLAILENGKRKLPPNLISKKGK